METLQSSEKSISSYLSFQASTPSIILFIGISVTLLLIICFKLFEKQIQKSRFNPFVTRLRFYVNSVLAFILPYLLLISLYISDTIKSIFDFVRNLFKNKK